MCAYDFEGNFETIIVAITYKVCSVYRLVDYLLLIESTFGKLGRMTVIWELGVCVVFCFSSYMIFHD